MAGLFITMEGPDGAGKTTQTKMLGDYLLGLGYEIIYTREPGGTGIGEKIRQLLLDPQNHEMTSETEILLYSAARAQHVKELILPALSAGKVVICDRFIDSTLAYQGYGRGISKDLIRSLNQMAVMGAIPDLTLVFDLDPEDGLKRVKDGRFGKVDRLEGEDLSFHRRVRVGFTQIANEEPERCVIIEAAVPVEAVHQKVLKAVERILKDKGCGYENS